MTHYNERLLRHLLRAITQRPPHAGLPQPEQQEERDLLSLLMTLPASADPIAWLDREQGELCARITVWRELQRQWRQLTGLRRADATGHLDKPALVNQRVWLAAVFGDQEPGIVRGATTIPSTSEIDRALHDLRRDSAGEYHHRNLEPSLLFELLNLADTVDAVDWLQHERGHLIALTTLGDILDQSRPPSTPMIGKPIHVLRPNTKLSVGATVRVTVSEVVFGSNGFRLQLRVKARVDDGPAAADLARPVWSWIGFDRVVDNHGYHYLTQHRDIHVKTGYRGWSRIVSLEFCKRGRAW